MNDEKLSNEDLAHFFARVMKMDGANLENSKAIASAMVKAIPMGTNMFDILTGFGIALGTFAHTLPKDAQEYSLEYVADSSKGILEIVRQQKLKVN